MGFQDPKNNGQWDWLQCGISFDGSVNANANSRYWSISDAWSTDRVWNLGVSNVPLDVQQDWTYLGQSEEHNYTECPFLQKCVFQCSASRPYVTNDTAEDYAFWDGSTTVNFYYGVYYGTTMLL